MVDAEEGSRGTGAIAVTDAVWCCVVLSAAAAAVTAVLCCVPQDAKLVGAHGANPAAAV